MTTTSNDRKDRLAAALRENLKRRKQRARALARATGQTAAGDGGASAVKPDDAHPDSPPGGPRPKVAGKPL